MFTVFYRIINNLLFVTKCIIDDNCRKIVNVNHKFKRNLFVAISRANLERRHRFSSINSNLNPLLSRNCITVKYSSLLALVNYDLLLGGKKTKRKPEWHRPSCLDARRRTLTPPYHYALVFVWRPTFPMLLTLNRLIYSFNHFTYSPTLNPPLPSQPLTTRSTLHRSSTLGS